MSSKPGLGMPGLGMPSAASIQSKVMSRDVSDDLGGEGGAKTGANNRPGSPSAAGGPGNAGDGPLSGGLSAPRKNRWEGQVGETGGRDRWERQVGGTGGRDRWEGLMCIYGE